MLGSGQVEDLPETITPIGLPLESCDGSYLTGHWTWQARMLELSQAMTNNPDDRSRALIW